MQQHLFEYGLKNVVFVVLVVVHYITTTATTSTTECNNIYPNTG